MPFTSSSYVVRPQVVVTRQAFIITRQRHNRRLLNPTTTTTKTMWLLPPIGATMFRSQLSRRYHQIENKKKHDEFLHIRHSIRYMSSSSSTTLSTSVISMEEYYDELRSSPSSCNNNNNNNNTIIATTTTSLNDDDFTVVDPNNSDPFNNNYNNNVTIATTKVNTTKTKKSPKSSTTTTPYHSVRSNSSNSSNENSTTTTRMDTTMSTTTGNANSTTTTVSSWMNSSSNDDNRDDDPIHNNNVTTTFNTSTPVTNVSSNNNYLRINNNHNNNYSTSVGSVGFPGGMMMNMNMNMMTPTGYNNFTATSYAATSETQPDNIRTSTLNGGSSNSNNHNRIVPPSTSSTSTGSSSSSSINAQRTSSSEYIIISRTPIPTTTTTFVNNNSNETNTSASNATTTNDVGQDATSHVSVTLQEEELLDPRDLIPPNATTGEWKIPYPKALSPSSIKEFQACPQSFLFQYILGLRQPTTTVLAKGTMCHAALERIFDIEPHDRSLSVLQNLYRTAWSEQRLSDTYRILFEEDVIVDELQEVVELESDDGTTSRLPTTQPMIERRRYIQEERSWGQEGLALLENYWMAEDASSILRPNPVQREVWVKSNLPLILSDDDDDSTLTKRNGSSSSSSSSIDTVSTIRPVTSNITMGSPSAQVDDNDISSIPSTLLTMDNSTWIDDETSSTINSDSTPDTDGDVEAMTSTNHNFDEANITKFLVRGIVDRLDMVQDRNNKTQITLRLIDYKSGKAPDLKYSPSMNLKIQNEAFDQLLIYALLLREANRSKVNPMPLRYLRLFYLTSVHDQKAIYWDMDLGATQEERDAILRTVHVSLSNVYRNVCRLIDQQNFLAFKGCQRSFCYCHKCRPKFKPGTVWEPPPK